MTMHGPYMVWDLKENRCRAIHTHKGAAEDKAKALNAEYPYSKPSIVNPFRVRLLRALQWPVMLWKLYKVDHNLSISWRCLQHWIYYQMPTKETRFIVMEMND